LKVLGLLPVQDLMNRSPENIVHAEDKVQDVIRFLTEKSLEHAVVLSDDRPVGYVTAQLLQDRQGTVREAMAEYPVLLEERHSARDVLSHMLMHGLQTLSVINDTGNLAGTVSYRSIHQALKDIYSEENHS
jgi:predicted transcriptional regulator